MGPRGTAPNDKSLKSFISGAAPRNPMAPPLETPAPPLETPWRRASKPQVRRASKPLGTKGLATYRKAKITFTFHFSMLTLSNAFLNKNNRKIKSESGVSFAMASQPFETKIFKFRWFLGPSDQNELYHTPLLSKI